jgi:hypothetical protein
VLELRSQKYGGGGEGYAQPGPASSEALCSEAARNSSDYLILGADKRYGECRLDRYGFPDQPRLWIDEVIRDGMDALPAFVRSGNSTGLSGTS